jgi:hypothetical protein
VEILCALLFIYMIISTILNRSKVPRSKGGPSNQSIWPLLIVIGALIGGAALLLLADPMGGGWSTGQGGSNGTTTDPGSNGDGGAAGGSFNPITLVGVVIVALVIMIPVIRYLKGWGAFTKEDRPKANQGDQAEVLDQAISDIQSSTGDDLWEVVLRAYREMCRLIPSAVDHSTMTPREFADLAVVTLGWPEKAVRGLTEVFELARYSAHALGEAERDKALQSLAEIRSSVGPEVRPPAGTADAVKV